jgi:SAM-dependent methyltransferase
MNPNISKSGFKYSGTDNLEMMTQAKNYNSFLIKTLEKHLQGRQPLLDFGAGIGSFALQMRQLGFSVTCFEPALTHFNHLEKLGFDCGTSLDDFADKRFDGAYALNVLEHIEEDDEVLQQLHRILVPGGILVIYVPAFPILFSSMDRKVGHIRRYRAAALKKKVQEMGFRILHCAYVDVLGFMASLLFRIAGNSRGDLNPFGLKLFDRFLFPVSLFLDKFTSRFLGKNLLIVGEKR